MYYMTYNTILTSKGTTTIPAEIRRQLGIEPGMSISFVQNIETGEFAIKRSQTIEELREINKEALKKAGTSNREYQTGSGFAQHALDQYRHQQ